MNDSDYKIRAEHIDFFYGSKQTLFDVNLAFRDKEVTALIGPSGCGKSTFRENALAHERTHPRHPAHGPHHVGQG